jgi:catechol 2,3-dioxygenase-like lactoylglutathione lyase family enzyme
MRFGHVELPVKDPIAARAFYVDVLGFRHEETQGGKYVWLSLGGRTFLLHPDIAPPRGEFLDSPNLVLYTEELEARAAELRARGLALEGKPPCFRFRDPDGNWFQLVDPRGDHSGA